MKVAAYQAPLLAPGITPALDLIRERVYWCEARGISVLCCPEAVLGGLADYSPDPARYAFRTDEGQLDTALAVLASNSVTSIVGFTELDRDGRLYNAAAVVHHGLVAGLYRKLHPALRRSVYAAGSDTPVFRIAGLTFGILICNDSNHPEPARLMAAQGATVLFVPTNNGLPRNRARPEVVDEATKADVARAVENRVWIVRADVAGDNGELRSYGSAEVVDPQGSVLQRATPECTHTLVADIPLLHDEQLPHPAHRSPRR